METSALEAYRQQRLADFAWSARHHLDLGAAPWEGAGSVCPEGLRDVVAEHAKAIFAPLAHLSDDERNAVMDEHGWTIDVSVAAYFIPRQLKRYLAGAASAGRTVSRREIDEFACDVLQLLGYTTHGEAVLLTTRYPVEAGMAGARLLDVVPPRGDVDGVCNDCPLCERMRNLPRASCPSSRV